MKFVPVPETNVLFAIWETRVQDFTAFVESGYAYKEGPVPFTLTSNGWEQRDGYSWRDPGFEQSDEHPVTCVSWEDAKAFCEWLSKLEGFTYRLPTDHEWSVAVGIGDREDPSADPIAKDAKIEGIFPWGTVPPFPNSGNYAGREANTSSWPSGYSINTGLNDNYPRTAPAGSFQPNQLGLYDLGGNVWEWCEDWHDRSRVNNRVLRGASWSFSTEIDLRSSRRSNDSPTTRLDHNGFRCVIEIR